jgi:hypothetical protein
MKAGQGLSGAIRFNVNGYKRYNIASLHHISQQIAPFPQHRPISKGRPIGPFARPRG